jgi:hypothetical protein
MGGLVISNPIYREVIPRVLVQGTQDSLPLISPIAVCSRMRYSVTSYKPC